MSTYSSYRDGGKTTEKGIYRFFSRLFTHGLPLVNLSTNMAVTQRGAGANMSVDIAAGDIDLAYSTYTYHAWSDAVENVLITAADSTNPRRDIVVAYIDLSVLSTSNDDNLGSLKFKVVAGTPAGSPTDPSDPTIQSSVGSGNPYYKLARVQVDAGVTSIVDAKITDLRTPVALKARLWGGSSNTNGHTVPNVADDTVTLNGATQTLTGKTLTSPTINNPSVSGDSGWQTDSIGISAVTYLGNGSYQLTRSSSVAGFKSKGMRNRYTRTVAAPTQSASLNGSTQYFNDTTVSGMTFTDDFCAGAWINPSAYVQSGIISRYNGTSGWIFYMDTTGQIVLQGHNASASNYSNVKSYQSVSLGEWSHVAAQLDMSAFVVGATNSYVMIDGASVASLVSRAGTNPTALIQAGNIEVGSWNGGLQPFSGKIAQPFVSSAKITQVNMRTLISQGITSALVTANSIVSAYSMNGVATDLNTTNANDLSAQGSAGYTSNTFSGKELGGSTDYSITTDVSADGLTEIVQVPMGCTIPTSGGVSSSAYSIGAIPYGFPSDASRFDVKLLFRLSVATAIGAINTWTTSVLSGTNGLVVPVGEWKEIGYIGTFQLASTVSGNRSGFISMGTVAPSSLADELVGRVWERTATDALEYLHVTSHSIKSFSSQQTYGIWGLIDVATGSESYYLRGDQGNIVLYAKLAYI